MVIYKTGDLFNYWTGGGSVIAHGVNSQGYMGAGVARTMRAKFPQMFKHYKGLCRTGMLKPGNYFPWYEPAGLAIDKDYTIFNLVTQEHPGPNAKLEYIETSLLNVLNHCQYVGIKKLALPRIGCGIGGLKWDDVKISIEAIAKINPNVQVTVWSLEGSKNAS